VPGSRYCLPMRRRQQLVIDKRTSDVTLTAEVIDDDAGFGQRVAELQASVPDSGPGAVRTLTALCDGSGATAELDPGNPQMPDGWAECEDGDFCPACQARHVS
jgi:hypothetical protein